MLENHINRGHFVNAACSQAAGVCAEEFKYRTSFQEPIVWLPNQFW